MTAGGAAGSLSTPISFDGVYVGDRGRGNGPMSGGQVVTVAGSGLGSWRHSGGVRVGASSCEASMWESETSILCSVSHGVGSSMRIVATVGVLSGSMSEVM
eukprot:3432564-Rhodomonas_salina.1